MSPLVEALVSTLVRAGYSERKMPFRVASVDFEFTAAMVGSAGRSLDLIIIVDTASGANGDLDLVRVRQRVEALSRALDITGSRYVVTAVLAGATLTGAVEALAATCRVLTVENVALGSDGLPINDAASQALDDQIRVLLPLRLNNDDATDDAADIDPLAELEAALPKNLDSEFIKTLSDASAAGSDRVTQALAAALNHALALEETP